MKYVIFTYKGEGYPLAYKLQKAGADVTVGVVQDAEELGLPSENEDPLEKKARLALFDGMLNKVPAKYLIRAMGKIAEKDDYWVHFDFNSMFKHAQAVRRLGYRYGNFPTKEDHSLESDRTKAKEMVEKYYPDIKVGEFHEFTKIDDAIEFLEENEGIYVLKGSKEAAKTVAPETEDTNFAKNITIKQLKKNQKVYEQGGFILEKKILNMQELTPQMYLWNGKPLFTTLNIELKYSDAGSEGIQVGCSGNIIIKTPMDAPINKISFPKEVLDMYKGDVGVRLIDISLFHKDGEYFFGEFCPNRYGYDQSYSEVAMAGDDPREFFNKIKEGEDPIIKTFGAAIRSFNLGRFNHAPKEMALPDLDIQWDEEFEHGMWFGDIKKDRDESFVTTGYSWDLHVFTGASNDFYKAVELAYEAEKHCFVEKSKVRSKFDFLSTEYPTSIINRYRKLNGSAFTAEEI